MIDALYMIIQQILDSEPPSLTHIEAMVDHYWKLGMEYLPFLARGENTVFISSIHFHGNWPYTTIHRHNT